MLPMFDLVCFVPFALSLTTIINELIGIVRMDPLFWCPVRSDNGNRMVTIFFDECT